VPAVAIEHHYDFVAGVARAHLIEKQLHAVGIDVWQIKESSSPLLASTSGFVT